MGLAARIDWKAVAGPLLFIISLHLSLSAAEWISLKRFQAWRTTYAGPLNRQGYRASHDFASGRESPGESRIAVVGDSFAQGWGVGMEETFPSRIADRLEALGMYAEVMNFGEIAAGPQDEMETLRSVLPQYQPDLVVWQYYTNDVGDLRVDAGVNRSPEVDSPENSRSLRRGLYWIKELFYRPYPHAYEAIAPPLRRSFSELSSYRRTVFNDPVIARRRWGALYPADRLPGWDERWRLMEGILATAAAQSQEAGAGFLLLVIPDAVEVSEVYRRDLELWHLYEIDASTAKERIMHQRLDGICRDRKFACIDCLDDLLRAEMAGRTYLKHDFHLTAYGHSVVADRLTSELKPYLGRSESDQ